MVMKSSEKVKKVEIHEVNSLILASYLTGEPLVVNVARSQIIELSAALMLMWNPADVRFTVKI